MPHARAITCAAPAPARGAISMIDSARRPTPLRHSPFGYMRPARSRGLLDRLLRRPRPDLATQALQHLLARRDPTRVTPADVSHLLLRYGVMGEEARRVLSGMWRQVLS